MAMNIGSGGGGRKRGRSALAAEINVTPFVDVMLVLLIVFMITAPMMRPGVDLNLPNHRAQQMAATEDTPLTISIQRSGQVFLGESQDATPRGELITTLRAIAGAGYREKKVLVRADKSLPVESLTEVLALVQAGGFTKVSIPMDSQAGILQVQPSETE